MNCSEITIGEAAIIRYPKKKYTREYVATTAYKVHPKKVWFLTSDSFAWYVVVVKGKLR